MQLVNTLVIAVFVPLFPLSMVFNALFQRVRSTWLRAALLFVWPLPGLGLMELQPLAVTPDLMLWALFSSVLYGFRAVVVREVGVWTGFQATSSWALIWIASGAGIESVALLLHALAFSFPLLLLVFQSAELARRYESAYAGIVHGIARSQPRLAGAMVITLLAVIGSPVFPAFFAMLNSITHAVSVLPVAAAGVALVWLLWSWSGMRLMQELLVGPARPAGHGDIAYSITVVYGLGLTMLVVGGLYFAGMMT
jgi:hypothetical protein